MPEVRDRILSSLSPAVLPLTETVTAGKKRAARLTGGEGGPAKGGVGSGRLWRSRRGTARRRRVMLLMSLAT